jgi:hypothetical protein
MRAISRTSGLLALLFLASGLAGCAARSTPPPTAGYERGGIPELRGDRVIVLPVQLRGAGHPEIDREVEYALREVSPGVTWIPPASVQEALRRSPGTGIRIEGLPVRAFQAAELQRIGDPLFGDLYRLGAILDARWVLLPVEARGKPVEDAEVVELSVALIEARSGRVVWYGIVEGRPGASGELSATASVAEALARRLAG